MGHVVNLKRIYNAPSYLDTGLRSSTMLVLRRFPLRKVLPI